MLLCTAADPFYPSCSNNNMISASACAEKNKRDGAKHRENSLSKVGLVHRRNVTVSPENCGCFHWREHVKVEAMASTWEYSCLCHAVEPILSFSKNGEVSLLQLF